MRTIRGWPIVGLTLIGSLFMSACGSQEADATPTLSVEMIQTQAVATFAADLTRTAMAAPTETPTPMDAATSTVTAATAPASPTSSGAGTAPVASCLGMAFVSDVTIPDNTSMAPGNRFTKTWRVRNNGTCAWQAGFRLNFTGGEAMGGSAVTLDEGVEAGDEAELSVSLTAPGTAGTYRGNWRLSNAAGSFFGDEIFVVIVVSGGASATATGPSAASATATATLTHTPTATTGP